MSLWGLNDGTDTGLTVTVTTAGNTNIVFSGDPSANVSVGDVIVVDSDGTADEEHRVVSSVQGTTVIVSEGFTSAHGGGTDCHVRTPPKYVSKTDIKNEVIIGADTTEARVGHVHHAGWVKKHTKSRLGSVTSTWYETLVATNNITGDEETGGLASS
tara:strand:+ start:1007 stop:1477 length:471 start_codon:yes stop_codon:yes gene_type:complete